MGLGVEVKRLRTALGLTQKALAEAVGVRQPSLAKVEAGGGVDALTLFRLADALGVRCDHFRPFVDPAAAPKPRAKRLRPAPPGDA